MVDDVIEQIIGQDMTDVRGKVYLAQYITFSVTVALETSQWLVTQSSTTVLALNGSRI